MNINPSTSAPRSPANQDPTLAATFPGDSAVPTDLMRAIQGYGAITSSRDGA